MNWDEMSILRVENLTISFGGLLVLNGVSFEVKKEEIYAVIGPNGSGKTTVFNCINKIYSPQKGQIFFRERDITRISAHKICGRGIARTFQNVELFSNMTVMDNLLLGCHSSKKTHMFNEMFFLPGARRQEVMFRERAEEIIDFLNLQPYRNDRIRFLPFGVQKVVEMGRALCTQPELLLLDEPSSGLNPEECEDMIFWIEDIRKIYKITVLIVEHNMMVVGELADRVCALSYGEVIDVASPGKIQSNPDLIRAYLGEGDGQPTGT
jgi:branched-chain amino acid transport system ATP-binding protein